jgi:hypothetical protein
VYFDIFADVFCQLIIQMMIDDRAKHQQAKVKKAD